MSRVKQFLAALTPEDALERLPGGVIYAVNYHSIPAGELDAFSDQMRQMAQAGFLSCSPENLWSHLGAKEPSTEKRLLVSFDDGFADNLRAAEVLETLGWTGWFFVPAALATGQTEPLRKQFGHLPLMTTSDLRDLCARRHVIGAHGYNHLLLSDDLDDTTLETEIVTSRAILEDALGQDVWAFCWIEGVTRSYSRRAYRLIRSNYRAAFSTFAKPITPGQSPYFLDRTNLKSSYSDSAVRLALSPLTRARHFFRRRHVLRLLAADGDA